jgi:SseB protein N-terminal domain
VATTWNPVNDVERELAAALAAGDQRRYFQALRTAPLYLPVRRHGPDGQPQVLTFPVGGSVYLAIFTSVEALTAGVGSRADHWVRTGYADLAAHWPDPAWRLAIDPQLGIGAMLDIGDIARGARGELRRLTAGQLLGADGVDASDQPSNAVEWALVQALATADPARYLQALAAAVLLVPTDAADGFIDVFTSTGELTAARPAGTSYRDTGLADLLRGWSDPARGLRVNPGSVTGLDLDAGQVEQLRAELGTELA